jgi:hypothetical protein
MGVALNKRQIHFKHQQLKLVFEAALESHKSPVAPDQHGQNSSKYVTPKMNPLTRPRFAFVNSSPSLSARRGRADHANPGTAEYQLDSSP